MRWVCGILLVCAALLKSADLLNGSSTILLNPSTQVLLPAQIGAELGLGFFLLSGLYWKTFRWLSVALFAGFAGYSLYLAANGATSCGCFGPLHIHPWWTFALDVATVVGLLFSSQSVNRRNAQLPADTDLAQCKSSQRKYLAASIASATVLTAILLARYVGQRTTVGQDLTSTGVGLVILEPEKWIGKNLPIADCVNIDLSEGKWTVLLHRHGCPVCQETVLRYERQAAAGKRVALIEVPPFGDQTRHEASCRYGRLKDDREWFVQTPVEIQLNDGVVTAVSAHNE